MIISQEIKWARNSQILQPHLKIPPFFILQYLERYLCVSSETFTIILESQGMGTYSFQLSIISLSPDYGQTMNPIRVNWCKPPIVKQSYNSLVMNDSYCYKETIPTVIHRLNSCLTHKPV
jgi:hypothetical protein